MCITSKRSFILLVTMIVVAAFSVPSSVSARGPVNRHHPNRSSASERSMATRYYYPQYVGRRTGYSYVRAPFRAGDTVVVTSSSAKIMRGTRALGTASKGRKLTVRNLEGQWLGIEVEIDGKLINGWIWNAYVAQDLSAGVLRSHVPADTHASVECR